MDSLSLFLNRLNEGYHGRRRIVRVNSSKIVLSFLKILVQEGFLLGFSVDPLDYRKLIIYLKYINGSPVFKKLVRFSKPGQKVYLSSSETSKKASEGVFFLNTSTCGLVCLNNFRQVHSLQKLGGELIAQITF